MSDDEKFSGEMPADAYAEACVVVHRPAAPRLSRSVAFVWGGEAVNSPSLPFGRWKHAARAA